MRKKCIKCNIIRPVIEFPKDSTRAGGYYHTCRACHKEKMKKYYQTPAGIAAMRRYLKKRAIARLKMKRIRKMAEY